MDCWAGKVFSVCRSPETRYLSSLCFISAPAPLFTFQNFPPSWALFMLLDPRATCSPALYLPVRNLLLLLETCPAPRLLIRTLLSTSYPSEKNWTHSLVWLFTHKSSIIITHACLHSVVKLLTVSLYGAGLWLWLDLMSHETSRNSLFSGYRIQPLAETAKYFTC